MRHVETRFPLVSALASSALILVGCGGSAGSAPSGRLETLEVTGLALDPAFDPDVSKYHATPALCASKVQLRLRAETSGVRIEVNGKPLPPEATEQEIELEAETTFIEIRLLDPQGIQLGAYEIVLDRVRGIVQFYLKASYPDAQDEFGETVGVSDGTIVVGARNEDGDGSPEDDDGLENAGAAYVYVCSGDAWPQEACLKPSAPTEGALFG